MTKSQLKLNKIEEIIYEYGQIHGGHHKMWVLDQVMRIVKGDEYDNFVKEYEYADDEGVITEEQQYEWDIGIPP